MDRESKSKKHSGISAIPGEIFKRIEKQELKELPKSSYFEYFDQQIRKVDHTGIINYDGRKYTVPI